MAWYYNTSSGMLTHQTGTIANITGWLNTHTPGLGWHQLRVADSASYAQAAAEAVREFPHAAAPTGSTGTAIGQQVTSQVPGGSALVTTGQFLGKLNERQTWVRIAETTLGIALILVALSHMTGIGSATPVGRALKIAGGK
jgi:hypothetical protein